MTARFLVVMVLVACGSSPPPRPRPAEPSITTRAQVPADIQKRLPTHGVYVASGGDKSPVFRVVIDTDAKTIYTGSAPAGTPLHGPLPDERTRELTPRNEQHLMQLCADAQAEPPPATPPDPVYGYDELFVIVDGDAVFFVQGRGPIKRPRTVKAIEALRAAAAL